MYIRNTAHYIWGYGHKFQQSLVLIAFFVIGSSCSIQSATYYVATTGNDSNIGSLSNPWATISKANNSVLSGDTVILRGGEYSGENAVISPGMSGTAEEPITYAAYLGENPVITDTRSYSDYAINLTNRAYIVIDGIEVNGKQIFEDSNVQSWLIIDGTESHHNIVQNCTFRYSRGWDGLLIEQGSKYNRILNCYMDFCGAYNKKSESPPDGDDAGDLLIVRGEYNLVEGNILRHGGHNLLAMEGSFNVVRNNDFNNYWSDSEGSGAGNRSVTLGGNQSSLVGYNVFERNTIVHAGSSSDSEFNTGMKAENTNQIVRFNCLWNNNQWGVISNNRKAVPYVRFSRIYHNLFYNHGGAAWQAVFQPGGIDLNNITFKNNIVYKGRQNPKNSSNDADIVLNLEGEGLVLGGHVISHNLLVKNTPGDAQIWIKQLGNNSIDYMERNYSDNVFGNIELVPEFVSSNPSSANDFKPTKSSPVIDAADYLTLTNGSGSGTTVTVYDARYFSDGFGIVSGDRVKVGSNSPVEVVKVDYLKNELILATGIAWSDGDGVSFEYSGLAPDVGPWEYAGNSTP